MVFKCAFSRDVITIIQNKKSAVDHDVFVVINAENVKKTQYITSLISNARGITMVEL